MCKDIKEWNTHRGKIKLHTDEDRWTLHEMGKGKKIAKKYINEKYDLNSL